MIEFELLSPKLEGPRFAGHAIPLDFLKDLAVFEEFVISVAKAEWLKDNEGRQRTPHGFMSGVAVNLKQVDPGSAIPKLTALIASSSLLLPGIISLQQHYLQRACIRIVDAVSVAEIGGNVTEQLPAKMLTYFDRFGRGLRDGESIIFNRDERGPPARLTPQTRRKLVLAAPDVQFITDDAMLRGKVVDTNDTDRTFTIELANGQEVTAPLAAKHRDTILDAQKESRSGVRVAVRGIGLFNRANKIVSFEDVEDVSPLEPLDVPARFDELRLLKPGWLYGSGKQPDTAGLDKLGILFNSHYPSELPLPYTFPTEEGGIQFEWRMKNSSPEIEIDLVSLKGEWLSEDEATIDLNTAEGWADLTSRLTALVEAAPNKEAA